MKTQTKNRTKNLALTALFTALIAAGAFVKIPIPPMPFTLQTLFVTLAGMLLGGGSGAASVAVYVLIGLIGLPIFTTGGGLSYVLQPTFGYLSGFILSAFLTGFIARRPSDKAPSYARLSAAGVVGIFAVYAIGLPYFYLVSELYLGTDVTMRTLFLNCFLLTLPVDALKTIVCVFLAKKLIPFCPTAFRTTKPQQNGTKTPDKTKSDEKPNQSPQSDRD